MAYHVCTLDVFLRVHVIEASRFVQLLSFVLGDEGKVNESPEDIKKKT